MVMPKKRRSIISQEERILRLKESRQKYSLMAKSKLPPRAEPRPSIAPSCALPRPPKAAAPRASIAPKQSARFDDEIEFEVDSNSMEMIRSGRVTIPVSRPSISGARSTLTGRLSLARKPASRFRQSIAQEPRASLMPLGINLFEANASQRNEISEYLNKRSTPAKPTNETPSGGVFSNILSSVRQRKIRFMDNAIQEVRESAESAEVAAASSFVHHSPMLGSSYMPVSILSTKKNQRMKVNLDGRPAQTPRRINFDEADDSSEEPEKKNDVNEAVHNVENAVQALAKSTASISDEEADRIKNIIDQLQKLLDDRNSRIEIENKDVSPKKRKNLDLPVPLTPLGSIFENVNLNDSVEIVEDELPEMKKKKRRSSRMKVGVSPGRRSLKNRRSARGVQVAEQ